MKCVEEQMVVVFWLGEKCESCRAPGRHCGLEERLNVLWPFSEAHENPLNLSPQQDLRLGLGAAWGSQ